MGKNGKRQLKIYISPDVDDRIRAMYERRARAVDLGGRNGIRNKQTFSSFIEDILSEVSRVDVESERVHEREDWGEDFY